LAIFHREISGSQVGFSLHFCMNHAAWPSWKISHILILKHFSLMARIVKEGCPGSRFESILTTTQEADYELGSG